jgi:DNA-binding NarL/FixJ family response regulator
MRNSTLALVDDHPVLLKGLGDIIADETGFCIVAFGMTAQDAVDIAGRDKPDVIIIDLNMPGNAFEAISIVASRYPDTKVIVFTAASSTDIAVKALEAGASGYVLKGSTIQEVKGAIFSVLKGDTYISQDVAFSVITALRGASKPGDANPVRLSKREEQVVTLLLSGKTNREIAAGLGIGEKTVKHYMTILMQKLQVRNRLEVVIAAQRLTQVSASPDRRNYIN